MARIAIVGSGIAGLAAARELSRVAAVTLFEAEPRAGGHAHTVELSLEGLSHGVDTGFLVYNERNYPNLVRLFAELGVVTAPSDMSFSVQCPARGLEWCGSDLAGVFAQRRNLASPRFLRMLADIVRFNRAASALVDGGALGDDETVAAFLDRHRFGTAFRDDYFLPMVGAIWSCPTGQMLQFPVATLLRFCRNHGLLQVADRPRWRSVLGGSREYVRRIVQDLPDLRLATPVRGVRRLAGGGVVIATGAGIEHFDQVVLACHSDDALALLADEADADERRVLGAIGYRPNRALLHLDTALLPRNRAAWAAWNFERSPDESAASGAVCVHYLINRLQPLPWRSPVIVSLNPVREPARVLREFEYRHPVFDTAAIRAQQALPRIQGRGGVWYCGAWAGHGFHEDGLSSALAVAARLQERLDGAPPVALAA